MKMWGGGVMGESRQKGAADPGQTDRLALRQRHGGVQEAKGFGVLLDEPELG